MYPFSLQFGLPQFGSQLGDGCRHSDAKHDIDYRPYGYSCNHTSSTGLFWMNSDASRGLLGNHWIICLMLHDISLENFQTFFERF